MLQVEATNRTANYLSSLKWEYISRSRKKTEIRKWGRIGSKSLLKKFRSKYLRRFSNFPRNGRSDRSKLNINQ